MGVTIYDIADRAGVSIATVSRVFNNHARVSDRTRARVLAIADKLGYQPHASAQSLARRRTSLVSAVIPVMANNFFIEVLRGLQDRLAESEFDLLVYSSRMLEEAEGQLERALHRGRSAGVLLFSTPLAQKQAERIKRSSQPLVLVDSFHPDFDSVSIDNEQGGYIATQALIERGYERVALIMAHPASVPAAQRRTGYEKALREAGRSVDDDLIYICKETREHGYSEKAGYEAMRALLGRREIPDAVFVTSDIQALGVMEALKEDRLVSPGDVSIIGFDDIPISKYLSLSTLRQPMYEMGKLAVEKLLMRIKHPDHPTSHTVFSPRLIHRSTSDPAQASPVPVTNQSPTR